MSDKIKTTTEFYPFPWDEESKYAPVPDDDLAMAESILNVEKEDNNG